MNITENKTVLEKLLKKNAVIFPKPLEKEFKNYSFETLSRISRYALLFGIIIWASFGIIDLLASTVSLKTILFVRFVIVWPFLLTIFILMFTSYYPKFFHYSKALIILSAGLGIYFMIVISHPTELTYNYYIYGVMVVMVYLYAIPGGYYPHTFIVGLLFLMVNLAISLYHYFIFSNQFSIALCLISNAFILSTFILGSIGSYFYEISFRHVFLQQQIIYIEEKNIEDLMLNIFPKLVVEQLKRGHKTTQYYRKINVLFADIVNFTYIVSKLSPNKVVSILNKIFSIFDRLAEKYELEKIKTIGDAYMVVSGLSKSGRNHAEQIADFAIEMKKEVSKLRMPGILKLQIRIGINTGSAVAGIIGYKKLAYDLWGDTINVASRMESYGLSDAIQVSKSFYESTKDKYDFEDRGYIVIKGKGKMHVYLLIGKKKTAS